MITIHKFPFLIDDRFSIRMPKGARVLSVQMQKSDPVLWAMVNTDAPLVERHFRLWGTGHEITPPVDHLMRYLGTFQMAGGALVFHLFEPNLPHDSTLPL